MLKIGIIGVGSISNMHINGYLKNPAVELYAFCDINENRLKAQGERYGITRLYTSVEAMLAACPELDAVSVCTWNNGHADCAIAALNSGKHVLCEKPMAISHKKALQMQKAAKDNDRLLMIGFVRRFGNDCRILQDFIKAGDFGEIYYAKATYLRRNGSPGGWFGDKSRSGGGPVIDLGVHVIDMVRYLMGNPKPVSVYAATFCKLGNRPNVIGGTGYRSADAGAKDIFDVEDLASAMIRMDNGSVISLETSFSLNIESDVTNISLFGTKAGAELSPELKLFSVQNGYLTNVSLATPTALSFDGLFDNEIHHFVDCLLGKTTCKAPAEDGVTLMQILDAIYESAKTGHEVIL